MVEKGFNIDRLLFIVVAVALLLGVLSGNVKLSPSFGVSASSCESVLDKISDDRVLSYKDINSLKRCSNLEVERFIGNSEVESSICTDPDADIDENRVIDVADVIVLLQNWGCMPSERNCPTNNRADINRDDIVDVGDIIELLRNWGAFRYCLGDINLDGYINFFDLGIVQDEWMLSGEADLNGDGIVDDGDLGILIDAWDDKEGTGVCDEFSIPNNIGGCTEIICDLDGSDGSVDGENEFLQLSYFDNEYLIEGISGSYSVRVDLASEEIVVEDRFGEKRVSLIDSPKLKQDEVEQLAGGYMEIINVTYNKTSDLAGGYDSEISSSLFCYDIDSDGKPNFDRGFPHYSLIYWRQDPGEVRTEQLVIDEDYSAWDKCHIRLNEAEGDHDIGVEVQVSLVADVADEIYFSDTNLIESAEVFNSLKEQIPDNEKITSIRASSDYSNLFGSGSCGSINDFKIFTNGHPDFEEIYVYTVVARRADRLRTHIAHKEVYLAQAWKGLPLEDDEVVEIQSIVYNPAVRGGFAQSNALFFALNLLRGGTDGDIFAVRTFLPDPFTRKLRVHTFNELVQGVDVDSDYIIRARPRIGFLQRHNDMDIEIESLGGNIDVGLTLLEYFDDFVRQPFIDGGGRAYGYLYDIDRLERFRVNYIRNESGEYNLELGDISTRTPGYANYYGTGLNILDCGRPQDSNPEVGECVDGVYTFRHDYVEEFGEGFVGEDCVRNIGGFLSGVECED